MPQRLRRQDAPFAHRLIAQDGADQLFESFVGGPARHRQDVEPARQLHVALYGFARFHHSEADEGRLEIVADEPQHVQHGSLLPIGAGEDVVHFVDDENLDLGGPEQVQRGTLGIDDARAWIVRRSKRVEDLSIESALSGPARHLKRQHGHSMSLGFGIDAGRMVRAELLHQHGLAHARVAEDRDRGHSRRAGMVENLLEDLDRLLHPGIAYPTLRAYRADLLLGGADQEAPLSRRSRVKRWRPWPPYPSPGTGVDESTPFSDPNPALVHGFSRLRKVLFIGLVSQPLRAFDQASLPGRRAQGGARVPLETRRTAPLALLIVPFMQRHRRPGQIAPVSFHEMSRRPADKDPRDVARIVLDDDFSSRTTEVRGQSAMPVFQGAKHVDAIGPQFAARFRQEGHPKGHAVFRHSQRRFADELPPNRDRRALQAPMNSLVIALDDLDRKICLELVQSQTGGFFGSCRPRSATLLKVVPGTACTSFIIVPISRSMWPP